MLLKKYWSRRSNSNIAFLYMNFLITKQIETWICWKFQIFSWNNIILIYIKMIVLRNMCKYVWSKMNKWYCIIQNSNKRRQVFSFFWIKLAWILFYERSVKNTLKKESRFPIILLPERCQANSLLIRFMAVTFVSFGSKPIR